VNFQFRCHFSLQFLILSHFFPSFIFASILTPSGLCRPLVHPNRDRCGPQLRHWLLHLARHAHFSTFPRLYSSSLLPGGYWPSFCGADIHVEVEMYNGSFNTGHFVLHSMNETDPDAREKAEEDHKNGFLRLGPTGYQRECCL